MHNVFSEFEIEPVTSNQSKTMNVNQTSSAFQPKNSEAGAKTLSSESGNQRLSFENIRSFRQHFEQGITPLRSILGDDQHQTMIVAMYEGTEKLLNQDISEFAVLEYLEELKLTAKELFLQGVSGEQFKTSLLEHSKTTIHDLVRAS